VEIELRGGATGFIGNENHVNRKETSRLLDSRRRQEKESLLAILAGGRRRLTPRPLVAGMEGAGPPCQWPSEKGARAGLRLGLRGGPRRGACGPLGRAEGKEGQRPLGPAEGRRGGGWLGQRAKSKEMREKNKCFPFSFMKHFCKFIFKRF
jgi:hypothetical protein